MTTAEIQDILSDMEIPEKDKPQQIFDFLTKALSKAYWEGTKAILFLMVVFVGWYCLKEKPAQSCTHYYPKNIDAILLKQDSATTYQIVWIINQHDIQQPLKDSLIKEIQTTKYN